jgi:hypothetical protein
LSSKQSATRNIETCDLERFKYYTPFVRNIRIRGEFGRVCPVATRVLASLYAATNRAPVFPNLKTLIWSALSTSPEAQLCIKPFISSTLESFTIWFQCVPSCDQISQTMDTVSAQVPHLRKLAFYYANPTPAKAEIMDCVIPRLQNLSTLQQCTLTWPSLRHLSTFSRLRALCITCIGEPGEQRDFGPASFESLERLNIISSSRTCVALLRQVNSISFDTLSVDLREDDPDVCDLAAVIGERFSDSLRELVIDIRTASELKPQFQLHATALLPLLKCSNLVSFVLEAQLPIEALDDTFCKATASSWRNIETLHFPSAVPPDFTNLKCSVTLSSLLHFATHTHRLRSFSLMLDASRPQLSNENIFEILPQNTSTSSTLQLLSIPSCSPLESPSLVACFLRRIFPQLRVLKHGLSLGLEAWKGWERVGRFLENAECDVTTAACQTL